MSARPKIDGDDLQMARSKKNDAPLRPGEAMALVQAELDISSTHYHDEIRPLLEPIYVDSEHRSKRYPKNHVRNVVEAIKTEGWDHFTSSESR